MKKVMALILALTLCFTAVTPAFADGGQIDLKVIKTEITADAVANSGGYASLKINPQINDQYKMVKNPQSALMDKSGNLVFPFRDTWLDFHYDPASGVVSLVGPVYTRVYSLPAGEAEIEDDPAFYDLKGNVILNTGVSGATPMRGGYALVLNRLPDSKWKLYGDSDWMTVTAALKLIDRTGKTVYSFPDEYGVEIGGMGDDYWGDISYLNSAKPYSEGMLGCVSRKPETMDAIVEYMDLNGKKLLATSAYTNCAPFSEGLAAVFSPDKLYWGYMDKTGTEVISCIYDDARPFSDGLAAVSRNDKWGCVDREGNVPIPLEYEDCYGAACGLVAVKKDGKCGLVDYDNNVVLPFVYDDITACENGVAYAIRDRSVYIIKLIRDPSETFTDVPSEAWYHNAVAFCVREGLFNGTSDTTFEPNTAMTRAMFVMVLANHYGADTDDTDVPTIFTDVPRNKWYTAAVKWANENGIVAGVGEGLFKPNDPVTREQICVMMVNYCKFVGIALTPYKEKVNFADAARISSWARTAVETCQRAGLVEGYNGYFNPKDNASRAQVAQIFTNLLD